MSNVEPVPDWNVYNILRSVGVETRDELDEATSRVEQYVATLDSERHVRTSATFDDEQYHLNQVIEESVSEDVSSIFDDDNIEWIIVGLDGGLKMATPDFSDTTFVPEFRIDSDEYVPQYVNGDIPIFGY